MWIHLIASLYRLHFDAEIMNYSDQRAAFKENKTQCLFIKYWGGGEKKKKTTSMRNSPLTHHFSRLVYVLKLCMKNPSKVNVTTPTPEFSNLCSFFQLQGLNPNPSSDTTALFKISIFIKLASYYIQCFRRIMCQHQEESPMHSKKQTFWTKEKKDALGVPNSDFQVLR